jgi:sialidase-1
MSPYFAERRVFSNGKDGYQYFRIPAIVKTLNGDLLAFAEGRVHDWRDFGHIEIVMKRSTDNGVTWSDLQVVATNKRYVAGNPGVVVDTKDPDHPGKMWLAYNTNKFPEEKIMDGTGVREVWVTSSVDDGNTWSSPLNITPYVHRPHQPEIDPGYNFGEDWRWHAVLPGHAIQLQTGRHAGRLLFPANHSRADRSNCQRYFSHAFWSDDHGHSWHLGQEVDVDANEAMAVELGNGQIMMNMRNYDGQKMRAVATSSDGGCTWDRVWREPQLPDPTVQASIIRYTTDAGDLILFANPSSTSMRENMTVRVSYDLGETWATSRQIRAGESAYSDLVIQEDGRIGLLYEDGNKSGIYYAHFELAWLLERV